MLDGHKALTFIFAAMQCFSNCTGLVVIHSVSETNLQNVNYFVQIKEIKHLHLQSVNDAFTFHVCTVSQCNFEFPRNAQVILWKNGILHKIPYCFYKLIII